MSVFNGADFLEKAVDSILAQVCSDFEFLILDDGSTDNTWDILAGFQDSRIRLVKNSENMGLTKALNKGLEMARGEYVARMDADDISLPERLQRQETFLKTNNNVAMVGCGVDVIDESGKKIQKINFPTIPYLLKWRLLLVNTFAHSAVMFRKDAVIGVGGYSEKLKYAQDYDLWSRICAHWEVANIPDVLVQWRFWKEGISVVQAKEQEEVAIQVAKQNINYVIGRYPEEGYFEYLRGLYTNRTKALSFEDIEGLNRNTRELLDCFYKRFNYTSEIVKEGIKFEIATYILSGLFKSPCSISVKVQMMLHWINQLKLHSIFRMFPILFSRRKEIGTRIQNIFRQH